VRTFTCSATWKVFEWECVLSKRYACDSFTPLRVVLIPDEMEVGVKFLKISQAEFEPKYKHSGAQLGRLFGSGVANPKH